MNKILKLSTVSILAIVAATNANAAGYTCEELIEYTSCNAGYFLNSGKCIEGTTCGAGNYIKKCSGETDLYYTGYCGAYDAGINSVEDLSNAMGFTYEECAYLAEANEFDEFEYYPEVCITDYGHVNEYGENHFSYMVTEEVLSDAVCTPCYAGSYQESAGKYSCTTCPAGSECATTGLATHTLCELGEYSSAGATACSSCPATGLVDKGGVTVVATTANKGSTSMGACYVGEEYYFTDTKGVYHYKSDCSVKPWKIPVTTEEECVQFDGFYWYCDAECECLGPDTFDSEGNGISAYAPTTEEECNKIEGTLWQEDTCKCEGMRWYLYEDGLQCNRR